MEENEKTIESTPGSEAQTGFGERVKYFFRKDIVQYIVKRLLMFIPTLLLISVLVFFVIQLPPGDYVSSEIAALATEGELVDADYAAQLRADYGLDLPLWQQYIKWIKDIITDFEGNKDRVTAEVMALCEKYPIYN